MPIQLHSGCGESRAKMIGLPSRLTVEPREQVARARALASAKQQEALAGNTGIRVDTVGRRYRIKGARVCFFATQEESPGTGGGLLKLDFALNPSKHPVSFHLNCY
jgi:hypothetical protein